MAIIAVICLGVVALALGARRRLPSASDARNVSRLAAHFGWREADAARVYYRSRRIGFGAAYRQRYSPNRVAAT